MQESITSNK